MANSIYRGYKEMPPETVNLPVAGAYLPGLFVTEDGVNLTQATTGEARVLILMNRDFYEQGPTDAYVSGDTGLAYRVKPESFYQVQFAAGTYAKGDPLTVNASGQAAAATTGTVVVAYYDGAGAALSAADLDDIVIANSYKAA